ncbi:MAG: alpha/beta hydrolase [Gemmatales bacterium]
MHRLALTILLILLNTLALHAGDAPGVVFVAGGAGSITNLAGIMKWSLRQADSPLEVRDFDWSHGKGRIIRDIQDIRHLVQKADELAQQILEYQAAHPDRPIYLVGRSTGAMIVLLAAEKLPLASVERIILLSPAVSPNYDLTPALRTTRAEIVSFHSRLDIPVLNWGTSLVGTADRYYTPSAGLNGFTIPAATVEYQRLKQIEWSPSKAWYGHLGGHLGNGMPLFLLYEVVPHLNAAKN